MLFTYDFTYLFIYYLVYSPNTDIVSSVRGGFLS